MFRFVNKFRNTLKLIKAFYKNVLHIGVNCRNQCSQTSTITEFWGNMFSGFNFV